MDFRIGQFCLFYILEDEDKVGVIFEYSAMSKTQVGVSWNPTKLPTFKYGSQNMTIDVYSWSYIISGRDLQTREFVS